MQPILNKLEIIMTNQEVIEKTDIALENLRKAIKHKKDFIEQSAHEVTGCTAAEMQLFNLEKQLESALKVRANLPE